MCLCVCVCGRVIVCVTLSDAYWSAVLTHQLNYYIEMKAYFGFFCIDTPSKHFRCRECA